MAIGQREGRRRRVLREDSITAASTTKSRSGSNETRPYADEALVELQPRITDLIPDRLWGLTVVLLFGFASVVAVQGAFYYRANRLAQVDYQVVSGLNLSGPGTIMSWLSSLYLLIAGGAALLVFNTRRHKIDDYRGRYSLWLWVSLGCTLASLDASTGLHLLVQHVLSSITGTVLWGDGSIWWIAVWCLAALLLGCRALIDMWPCRSSVFFLSAAALGYAFAASIHLGLYQPQLGQHNAALYSSVLLTAHFWVLYSFLLYARSIHRLAQGLVAGRKKRTKTKAGWWTRQRERFVQARTERAAVHAARRAEKTERAEARQAEREQARQQALSKKLRQQGRRPGPGSESSAADSEQPENTRPKRVTPIQVNRTARASNDATSQDGEIDMDQLSIEELELELLTNPNLSRVDRRKLRKRLKHEQYQQRRAA